jgi:hypothetical protein
LKRLKLAWTCLLSTTLGSGGNMIEDEVKYLIFLAIKAERERIVKALDRVYGYYDAEPNSQLLVRDIKIAIAGD